MVEIFEIFWSAKIELRVIILATSQLFLLFGIGKKIKERKKNNNKKG